MNNRILLLILIFCSTMPYAFSQTRMASVFTDNMVIKQNSEVAIWGTSNISQYIEIIVSWAPTDTIKVRANNMGRWKAVLKTPKADMVAHTIRCNELKITNVMLGEVWLCSGQSNMEWNVNYGILDGEKEAAAATYPNIRIFQVPLLASNTPQDVVEAKWMQSTPETMRTASALGFFFAKMLHKGLDVPIGIISSAWGGTPAEVWTPKEYFDKEMLENRCKYVCESWPTEPGLVYNQMIHPLTPFSISGCIWYQGESNREVATHYNKLMKTLIESWRERFCNNNLPFYFVQIAPFNYSNNTDLTAAMVRQAQEQTASETHHTGMVVVSDLVDNVQNIHPLNKQAVAVRLANYAFAEVYGLPIKNYKSPTYASMEIKKDKAVISFHNATEKLVCSGEKIEGFTIADKDGVYVEAEARILGNRVEVWSNKIKLPTTVRYCFDDTSMGNLRTVDGLPVAPFNSCRGE